jgi:hypothetical protein
MEYRQFVVDTFERAPGKWRARVSRTDGKRFRVNGHIRTKSFVIGSDATMAADALLLAMAVIDGGLISPAEKAPAVVCR